MAKNILKKKCNSEKKEKIILIKNWRERTTLSLSGSFSHFTFSLLYVLEYIAGCWLFSLYIIYLFEVRKFFKPFSKRVVWLNFGKLRQQLKQILYIRILPFLLGYAKLYVVKQIKKPKFLCSNWEIQNLLQNAPSFCFHPYHLWRQRWYNILQL